MIAFRVLLLTLLALSALAATDTEAAERVETIPTRPGVSQGLYIVDAEGPPWATAILYVGGQGNMALNAKGPTDLLGNFLSRITERLSKAGVALVYPDTPSDHRSGYGNFRSDPAHATDAAAILAWWRERSETPVFVIGTSRGTISAASIGAALAPGTIAGVALTSSVTRRNRSALEAIDGKALERIGVPVLVMANRDDRCDVTPPSDVPKLIDGLKNAPAKKAVVLSGGLPPTAGPCDGKSAHGYYGLEDEATRALVDWMKSVVAAR